MPIKSLKTIVIAIGLLSTSTAFADGSKQIQESKTNDTISIVENKTGIKPSSGSIVESLYKEAVDWLKTPYRYGGNSRKGIDCSAFTGTIYRDVFGVQLNRSSKDISAQDVKEVVQGDLKPGDLVFFATSRRKKGVTHVGVYLGNRHFVHASTNKGVTISSLDEPYYKRTYVKGGEVKSLDKATLYNLYASLENVEGFKQLQLKPLFVEADQKAPAATSSEIMLKKIPDTLITQ